ncbi:MAG: ECF transporter S component [Lachnospiraceae bacterium]|nr:ECF transporter S component [Lachnospiraceae bacterium]
MMPFKTLSEELIANLTFVVVCLVVVLVVMTIAVVYERIVRKKNGGTERILSTRKIVVVGIFSAISLILFLLDFPVFFAPAFYRIDFSELPALIAAFAYGPVAGVLIELIKILLKLCIKGTSTAFVGELANFVIGVSFLLPAAMLYEFRKTKNMALISCLVGTLCMTAFGTFFNAVYLLPAFATLYGMPMDAIIGMGSAINASIRDVTTFVFFAVAPINLLKGGLDSLITVLVYKKLRPFLKTEQRKAAGAAKVE